MPSVENPAQTLTTAFTPQQADLLARAIHDSYSELVEISDFNELEGIVRELALSQERVVQ